MAVYSLIFRCGVSNKVRLQALMNIFCAMYLFTMTFMVTHVAFFYIVPECYYHDGAMVLQHRLGIWYVFTAVVGNYLTCIFTETAPKPEEDKSRDYGVMADQSRNSDNIAVRRKAKSKVGKQSQDRKKKSDIFCKACDMTVPIRTHHCYLCEKCVTKRDHHCFFMGVCIGKANHIYFILFTLFMGVGTFYGMLLMAKYLNYLYGIQFHGPQTFLSLFLSTIMSLLQGQIPSFRYLGVFLMLYVSLAGTLASFGFLFWHMLIVARGQTTYEALRGITKFSKDTYIANIQQVFSRHSLISLFIPFWDLVVDIVRQR
ncbi:uncharacterized protein LOC132720714 [Ruditapes philippinarum]|uniref:uncharacterized protein LOC132720714 n=1 Tax=Ruditapes philippinarum TaxID=129788 RepID=UPI00295AB8EE|nr:uncharacterized protein LOC132720714 [Ruditapes philippinarum]